MMLVPDATILSLFDADGVYTGPAERCFMFMGELIDIDEYAASSGLILPDAGE